MKRFLCFITCTILVLSVSLFPTHATTTVDDQLLDVAMNDSRDGLAFVEGAIGYYEYSFLFLIDNQLSVIREQIFYSCTYINVPYSTNRVEAYLILDDFSDYVIGALDAMIDMNYTNAEKHRSASRSYNCHSYAWYDSASSNTYWIDDPTNYYSNNAYYTEVTTPAVGDIICYFNGNVNLHSGIVTAINVEASNNECGNANTVEVISKWGMAGLYMHNGYECPYTSYSESGEATSVKYYRHIHSYSYTNVTIHYQHRATCRTCGYTFTESHNWKPLLNGSQRCLDCGVVYNGPTLASNNLNLNSQTKE